MADPGTWMYVAMAASAVGAVRQAQAQSQAASYNSQIAQQNALAAQQQGEAAAQAQARDAQRRIGAMIAGYGASGVDVGSGSPQDVLADSVRSATLDNLTTKYNYKLKGQGYINQSQLDSMEADNASSAGWLNAASGVASGMSRMNQYGSYGSSIPYYGAGRTSATGTY